MAIEKKIKLYVSDATGERKVAKYYRIPLTGDSLPYNAVTNPAKDTLRIYAKISGDRIMFSAVNNPSWLVAHIDDYATCMDAFKINLPEEFLNSGESTVAVTSYANDGNEAIKYSVTKGIINLNTMTQSFVDKESMFTPANSIISDEYTNLVEVAPSEWVEKDNINEILREITTWRATTNPYIPDAVTEESIKTHSEFHEIKPEFFSNDTANDSEYYQFYHEYAGRGHMGDSFDNNIQGYSIPEGMLIGDELDMIISADLGANMFICTIDKDGTTRVRKYGITDYEYQIDSVERGGYRVHLTGAANISKFIIAFNQRYISNAGFIYIKKSQFKLD